MFYCGGVSIPFWRVSGVFGGFLLEACCFVPFLALLGGVLLQVLGWCFLLVSSLLERVFRPHLLSLVG